MKPEALYDTPADQIGMPAETIEQAQSALFNKLIEEFGSDNVLTQTEFDEIYTKAVKSIYDGKIVGVFRNSDHEPMTLSYVNGVDGKPFVYFDPQTVLETMNAAPMMAPYTPEEREAFAMALRANLMAQPA